MSKKLSILLSGTALFAIQVYAQPGNVRRATITGNGNSGNGKCTIEVVVDGTAEVRIFGDEARLVTLAGQPAQWRRFECNSPMPRNPSGFRFSGVDGRGRQELVSNPDRGNAVVRIDDPQGGSEGYTFDITWSGGSGYNNGGYNNNGRYNNDRYNNGRYNDNNGRYDNDRYNRDRYNRDRNGFGNNNVQTMTCSSDDGRRNHCDTDTRGGVRLLRQRSDAACRQGSTWGYDRRGIWVDRGCRADFEVGAANRY